MTDAMRPPSAASLAVAGFFLCCITSALVAPGLFWWLLAGAGVLAAGFLLARHSEAASALWLVLAGCTLEMTLIDLVGREAFAPTIAIVKASGLVLAAICVLRFGPRFDPFNPAFGFLAMFAAGLAHGLHPGLSAGDSLRSFVGSAAPFAFSFSRLSRRWAQAIIGAACWIPLASVTAGCVLDMLGLRPLFVDSGGARLAALGHPAFLATIALTSVYASLIELYRNGRAREVILLAANAVILLLTGARAPLLYGAVVVWLTLVFVPSPALPGRARALMALGGTALLPVLAAFADAFSSLRLFNLLVVNDAGDLSGRAALWLPFERAEAASPWFGWGVGAGNVIVPQNSDIVRQMHTWAAHNEYLRIGVEGGQIGRALLVLLFVLWAWSNTRPLVRSERTIMRLVFMAFACHAFTDNVLISTSASVLFAFCSAVFARGALERRERGESPIEDDEAVAGEVP